MTEKKVKLQSLSGMNDVLPKDQPFLKKIQKSIEGTTSYYNFQKIEVPVLEYAEVFSKAAGDTSDIVEKEMYSFRTKGGDLICLRPEFTPGVVRSYIEHGMQLLPQPVELYAIGQCFRYDRPQKGRYRHFHQFDFEVIGLKDPSLDAQLISMTCNIFKDLKILPRLNLQINSANLSRKSEVN